MSDKIRIALLYFAEYYSVGYIRAITDLQRRGLTDKEAREVIEYLAEKGLLKINTSLGVIDYVPKFKHFQKQKVHNDVGKLRIVEKKEEMNKEKKEEQAEPVVVEEVEDVMNENAVVCGNCIHYHDFRCKMKPDIVFLSPIAKYAEECPHFVRRQSK